MAHLMSHLWNEQEKYISRLVYPLPMLRWSLMSNGTARQTKLMGGIGYNQTKTTFCVNNTNHDHWP